MQYLDEAGKGWKTEGEIVDGKKGILDHLCCCWVAAIQNILSL